MTINNHHMMTMVTKNARLFRQSSVIRQSRILPRCHFSSLEKSSTTVASNNGTATEQLSTNSGNSSEILVGSAERSMGNVTRHGKGDAVIVLNVGGKEFLTLRSTVNSNPVLADHVVRAETNREITKSGSIFIDRDPTHFDFILQYLRNRVEMLSYSADFASIETINMKKFTKMHVQLPKDTQVLRDLYIEATYYRIPELQHALSSQNMLTTFLSFISGSGANPFDAASNFASRLRTFLLTFTTLSATGATIAIQQNLDSFLKLIGWRSKEEHEPTPE